MQLEDDLEEAAECECPVRRTLIGSTPVVHAPVVVAVRRRVCVSTLVVDCVEAEIASPRTLPLLRVEYPQ